MIPTYELPPAAAARIYRGPRFHRRMSMAQRLATLRFLAEMYKGSHNGWLAAFGQNIERWLKRQARRQ